jgi:hypothetical protein
MDYWKDQPDSCAYGCHGAGMYLVKNDDREIGFSDCVCTGGSSSLVKDPKPTRLHAV